MCWQHHWGRFTFTHKVYFETWNVVSLTFQFVNEIFSCDQSNETSLAVLLHGTVCFPIFYKMKFEFFSLTFN